MRTPFDTTHDAGTKDMRRLRTKRELRDTLGLASVRMIENLMRRRAIPFIKLGHRTIRYSLPAVTAALARFEVIEIGRKAK